MERAELEILLNGRPLQTVLDVKTLVLDQIREMPQPDLIELFWKLLPGLSTKQVQDYLFMSRD